ncbi:hypothetical protein [Parasitella parasitica]|uniref:Uncharacterized protein n=1 Tax=Parasitella parasitica TaxID=35722 RepID=A0A0B7NKT4_9FUNG|nr:hypothetical protein [Parasitella parasitica]
MLTNWLSSWYQQNEQQQQLEQQESSFHNIEQTVGEGGEEDWVQVITPSVRHSKPSKDAVAVVPNSVTTIADSNMTSTTDNGNNIKGLSRQERRAKARLAVRELKKQARNAAMVTNRNKKGLASSTCLPTSPLTT